MIGKNFPPGVPQVPPPPTEPSASLRRISMFSNLGSVSHPGLVPSSQECWLAFHSKILESSVLQNLNLNLNLTLHKRDGLGASAALSSCAYWRSRRRNLRSSKTQSLHRLRLPHASFRACASRCTENLPFHCRQVVGDMPDASRHVEKVTSNRPPQAETQLLQAGSPLYVAGGLPDEATNGSESSLASAIFSQFREV